MLFGIGLGNERRHCRRSLPSARSSRTMCNGVVALMIGIAQGAYAFAPAALGVVRQFGAPGALSAGGAAAGIFIGAALAQGLAICAFLLGRSR